MCIISGKINSVSNTKLFCGTNSVASRQITVYANNVDNPTRNNTMILPVPFPQSIQFHDLTKYSELFNDCSNCFKNQNYSNSFGTFNNSLRKKSMTKSLVVTSVGSYSASIANSLSDLNLANPEVFTITEESKKYLAKHYNNPNFGFIICKLNVGNHKYHPFAYSHNIKDKTVFIPTRHFHLHDSFTGVSDTYGLFPSVDEITPLGVQGRNQTTNDFFPVGMGSDDGDDSTADDWSHDIYLYNVACASNKTVKQMDSSPYEWTKQCKIRLDKLGFELDRNCRNFEKVQIKGRQPNLDVVLLCV